MMFRRTVLVLGAFAALGAARPVFAPGLSFVIKTSTNKEGVSSQPGTLVQALNGVLRFEAQSDKSSYVLVNPTTKSLSMVMPSSKQYVEIKLADSTTQALGAMASVMGTTTLISDIQVSGTSIGSGGTVNGYPTNRYRITTSYAEAIGNAEGQRKAKLVEEFWVTNQLKDIPDPMEAFTRAFGGQNGMPQIGGTMSELMRKRGDAQRKLFTGLPLKSVTISTYTERDGTTTQDTTTTEIQDLKRVDLDPSMFTVPADYAKLDMKAFMNVGNQLKNALSGMGRKRGSDSSNANGGSLVDGLKGAAKDAAKSEADQTKQEAKDAAKEAAKSEADAAKEKAKCALGGMFGRKKC